MRRFLRRLPARAQHPTVPGPTPPSTWMSFEGNLVRNSLTLGTHSFMNFCPPLPVLIHDAFFVSHHYRSAREAYSTRGESYIPGTTVMTRIMSTELPSLSVTAVLGVAGEIATADRIPVDLISSTSSCADSDHIQLALAICTLRARRDGDFETDRGPEELRGGT